jgi:hypothetical protein
MTADSPSPDAVCTCLVPIVVIKAELRPLDPDQAGADPPVALEQRADCVAGSWSRTPGHVAEIAPARLGWRPRLCETAADGGPGRRR